MKQLVAAVVTLTAIVAGLVIATSLSSAAQEDGSSGDTTTTTTTTTVGDGSDFSGRYGFRLDGELPPELADLEACLTEQGIEIPEDLDHSFMFELRSEDIEGLAEALEACGLPGFGDGFPFGDKPEGFPFGGRFDDGFPFGSEMLPGLGELKACLTEQGIEIPEDLDHMFELLGEDIEGLSAALESCGVMAFGEDFPFGGELPDGFPFGDGFEFGFGAPLDLDELATCLSDLGRFDSVDQVRDKLEECLPATIGFGGLDGFEGIPGHGRNGFGFHFDGPGHFGFDLDDAPDVEGTST